MDLTPILFSARPLIALSAVALISCDDPTAPARPVELRVETRELTLEPREDSQIAIEVLDARGRALEGVVTWQSSDTSIASVDQEGNVRALNFGRADVTASLDTLRATVVVNVAVTGYRTVSAGSNHSCALSDSGRAYCWGYNQHGQLGTGDTTAWNVPRAVATDLRFASLSAGGGFTCGVSTEGAAHCWGARGSIGDGSEDPHFVPTAVAGGLRFLEISVGHTSDASYTCGRNDQDELYCWGHNAFRQHGNGPASPSTDVPSRAFGGMLVQSIGAGSFHLCVISLEQRAYCAGRNNYGQVGNGAFGEHLDTATAVATDQRFTSIVGGSHDYTCAITTDGQMLCWGHNDFSQLGRGTTATIEPTIAPALLPTAVRHIAAGSFHTCAVTVDDRGYCWGGAAVPRTTSPIEVPGDHRFSMIDNGEVHSCGVTTGGTLLCWGRNDAGVVLGTGAATGLHHDPSPVAHQ